LKSFRSVAGGFLVAVATIASASATPFTNETLFQTAAGGGLSVETFEGFAVGNQVGSLPALGVTFGELFPGQFPEVANGLGIGGTVVSGTNVLINNDNASLPADGPIVIFAVPGSLITALGYFNTSVDDTTRLSFFDSNDVLIENANSGNGIPAPFLGIFNVVGATRVEIQSTGNANNFISIDNLQIVTASITEVPEPGTLFLFSLGLAGLGFARRRRTA
jgi:hypothetical protein